MRFDDEIVMAYVDGELDEKNRAEFEIVMATDAELQRRVEAQRELKLAVSAAFSTTLAEHVPERLIAAARHAPAGPAAVSDLAEARSARMAKTAAAGTGRLRWSWLEWGSMAASLVLGLIVAQTFFTWPDDELTGTRDGRWVAQGKLADALSHQLAANQPDEAAIRVGVSFRDRSGLYCRTFAVKDDIALAGMACREAMEWAVQVLAPDTSSAPAGSYRMAGAAMPSSVLRAVEERMTGEPLDAEAEAAAAERQWQQGD